LPIFPPAHLLILHQVLKDTFGAFAKLKLEEGQGALEGPLVALDCVTREGLPLLADLVSATPAAAG
jgi:hypothetical protein